MTNMPQKAAPTPAPIADLLTVAAELARLSFFAGDDADQISEQTHNQIIYMARRVKAGYDAARALVAADPAPTDPEDEFCHHCGGKDWTGEGHEPDCMAAAPAPTDPDVLAAVIAAGNALASAGYQDRSQALYEWRRATAPHRRAADPAPTGPDLVSLNTDPIGYADWFIQKVLLTRPSVPAGTITLIRRLQQEVKDRVHPDDAAPTGDQT